MTRLVALALVAALASFAALDPFVCPDGCTTGNRASHSDESGSAPSDDCWVCQPAVSVARQSLAPPLLISVIEPERLAAMVLVFHGPPKQPPRRS